MKIELDSEYKKLCHIQSIKPGFLKIPNILILTFLTVLTVGIPLVLYWKWQQFRNLTHWFIFSEVENDASETSHYLIVDSFKIKGNPRTTIYRNWIVSPYQVRQQKDQRDEALGQKSRLKDLCKYIQHKNLRYVIKDNTLGSIKYRITKNLQRFLIQGLSADQIKESVHIYGETGCFKISFLHIMKKMLYQKHLRLVFMMFAVKKIIFGLMNLKSDNKNQINQRILSVAILVELLLIFLMMLGISIFGAQQHNKANQNIENRHYKVMREGQQIGVKIKDLCVGDVVVPTIGDKIYFKGIICAIVNGNECVPYAAVNEKLYNRKDNTVQKIPIETKDTLVQQINTINAGSHILNMGLIQNIKVQAGNIAAQKSNIKKEQNLKNKKNVSEKASQNSDSAKPEVKFYIIVSDNNYMQKFYESYKEASYFDNIDSIRASYDREQLMFHGFFLVLALIGTIFVSNDGKTHQNWFHILLSILILCFPFNLPFFSHLSQIISIIRLKMKGVVVVNPMIEQFGIANNLSIELSAFQSLQYRGFIKKSRCNGLPQPQLYENKQVFFDTYRRTREDSIYAFLGWIGVFNTPNFEAHQIYKDVFQDFGFGKKQNEYDDEDSNQRVTNSYNHIISIDWQETQRFIVSGMLMESIVIKNHCPDRPDKKCFTITQGEYTSEECFAYFDSLVQSRGTDQWKDVMQRLHLQGKCIKYISLKKIPVKDGERDIQLSRKQVETNSDFMGLLIFDEWPSIQSMRNLVKLDDLLSDGRQTALSIKFFSVRQQIALIGYDHTLRHAKIFHSMQSASRAEQTSLTKAEYQGVVHIGNGIIDQGSLLASDISVNMVSQSYAQSDFLITQTNAIFFLFHEGLWALYNTTLTVVCLTLFNFSKIIGELVLFEGDSVGKLGQISPLYEDYDKLFLLDFGVLMVPLILLNLYEPCPKLVRKDHMHFFRIQIMFQAICSLGGLAILYTIEFIDHGFHGACEIYEQGRKGRHLIGLRPAQHGSSMEQVANTCDGIVNFITVSFALLVILLIDRESSQRKARNFIVGMINKVYMFLLWIGTIIMYQIPWKNIIRASTIITVVLVMIFISELVSGKNKKQEYLGPEDEQQIAAQMQREEQEDRERARRRIRPYMSY